MMQNMQNSCKPLVSVVVPVYNVEKYVAQCLNSVMEQTYSNLEILIIDDGSTDSSGQICDSFAAMDARIRVVHQKNAGLSGARNTGIELSHGEYIVFIDSDDFVSRDFVRALADTACRTGSDIVQCYVRDFLYGEEPSDDAYGDQNVNIIRLTGRDMCKAMLDTAYEACGVVWNKLYKTALFEKLRFPLRKIHEDDFLVSKLYWQAAHVAIYEKVLYYYQEKRPDSIMNAKYSLKSLDGMQARKEQYEFFEQVGDRELCEKAKAEFIRGTARQIQKIRQSDLENKKEVISQLRTDAFSLLGACLFGRCLPLKTRAGLIVRLLKAL